MSEKPRFLETFFLLDYTYVKTKEHVYFLNEDTKIKTSYRMPRLMEESIKVSVSPYFSRTSNTPTGALRSFLIDDRVKIT